VGGSGRSDDVRVRLMPSRARGHHHVAGGILGSVDDLGYVSHSDGPAVVDADDHGTDLVG